MNFLTNIMTEADNLTFCPVRAMWVIGVAVGLGLEVAATLHKLTFDIVAYGQGLGLLMVAGGTAMAAKSKWAERSSASDTQPPPAAGS